MKSPADSMNDHQVAALLNVGIAWLVWHFVAITDDSAGTSGGARRREHQRHRP
jgi:hypothetical protein